ncbi:MAG: protoporphyrinogen oxidase HemJ [Rhodospirillales bacterium]|nr:protoporphyrinogen oxidase HemJ [Rhodospirillales bacterium]
MNEFLLLIYPWAKTVHIISIISWMAGLLYLPRIMVYHVEKAVVGDEIDAIFQVMEQRLFKLIMTPAMISAWIFGLLLAITPRVINWSLSWPWLKLLAVVLLTAFHYWINARRKDFLRGENQLTSRHFRMLNEVPTVLMIIAVSAVVFKY